MIAGLLQILVFQGVGELLSRFVLPAVPGAALGRFVLDVVGSREWWQRGFAIGIAAHGIGTSRAFNVHPEAGAYSSLAMGLHGVLGAVLIPMAAGRF